MHPLTRFLPQPLNAVMGFLTLALGERGALPPRVAEWLQESLTGARDLLGHIEKVLLVRHTYIFGLYR